MNSSDVMLNNKVEMRRNFTLCVSQGLVFMFWLKKKREKNQSSIDFHVYIVIVRGLIDEFFI